MGLAIGAAAIAQDKKKTSDEQSVAAEYLQSVVDSMRVQVDEGDAQAFRVKRMPLFKYSDPARGYSAAGVWRLGLEERPKGLVSLEYWARAEADEPRLMFEFISVTPARFELSSEKDETSWRTDGSAPEFVLMRGSPQPASTDSQRLAQMRTLARRFMVSERERGEFASLRLLPQPIDRYSDPGDGILDGATFIFAYGTNPELALLIECDANIWRYALMRMSWAEVVVELDTHEAARFPQLMGFPTSGPYRSFGHVIREK